jgi:hypothetical protein
LVIGGSKQVLCQPGANGPSPERSSQEVHGKNGVLGTFHDALKASFEDLYSDLKLFMEESAKLPKDVSQVA